MKIFITDETNITRDDKFEFFVYGGLIIDQNEVKALSTKLIEFKKELGIEIERPIKWSNVKWNGKGILDLDIHKKIKEKMLDEVVNSGCKIIIYLAPNDFHHIKNFIGLKTYHKFDENRYIQSQKYALNVCCFKFDKLLIKEDDHGLIFADEFMKGIKSEISKHCEDLYPNGKDYKYERISMPIMQLNNDKSLLHQFNDVVLGAITCSMREMEFNFLPKLKTLFLTDETGKILGYGINIYPKRPKTNIIKNQLITLQSKFERLLFNNV